MLCRQIQAYLSDDDSTDGGAVQPILDGARLREPVVHAPEGAMEDAHHRAQLRRTRTTTTQRATRPYVCVSATGGTPN